MIDNEDKKLWETKLDHQVKQACDKMLDLYLKTAIRCIVVLGIDAICLLGCILFHTSILQALLMIILLWTGRVLMFSSALIFLSMVGFNIYKHVRKNQ